MIRVLLSKAAFLALPVLMVVIGFFLDQPNPTAQSQPGAKESAQTASPPARQIVPDNSPSIIQMATKLAKQSQFSDGIKLLGLISSEQSEYQTAQTLSKQWVKAIGQRGKDKIQQGQVHQGLAILHSIPPEDRPAEVTNLIARTQRNAGLAHAH